jgi:hypothetical protein
VEVGDTTVAQSECRLAIKDTSAERIVLEFAHERLRAEVLWWLDPRHAFVEKQVAVTFRTNVAWKGMVVSRPTLTASGLEAVCYAHPSFHRIESSPLHRSWKLKRPSGTEPVKTYFGRTAKGGFYAGLEMPFDSSSLKGDTVELSFSPSLRVKPGERQVCEPMYLGVYRRDPRDARAAEWRPADEVAAAAGLKSPRTSGDSVAASEPSSKSVVVLPLPSESDAMVAMTAAILGPRRHGLKALACGWHCQMTQATYTPESLDADLRALAFLKECGLDGVTDSHPWGGETTQMNQLREGDRYQLGAEVRRFLDSARDLGLIVTQWPTMNNTHPWKAQGGPFRQDRPEWLRGVAGQALGGLNADNYRQRVANCLACEPFFDWLLGIQLEAVRLGNYRSWCMDGDFWGTGAYYHTTVPVTCTAQNHGHLAGDSNYACQRALDRLIAAIRRSFPEIYIVMCRPPMDLGVWSNRNVDACFTLIETGTGASNLAAGDEIRTASRIRVHHHFFPHTLDWPLLFPSYGNPAASPPWPRGHLDYILLSALSSAPNLLFYLPARTGIPKEDQAEIRTWLDWGRRNEAYLMVRKDLFDWPGAGRVDGSAHVIADRGFLFLFNTSRQMLETEFSMTSQEVGVTNQGHYRIDQEHPSPAPAKTMRYGEKVTWNVPPQSAVLLRIRPAGG